MSAHDFAVVIPSIGRPALFDLLDALRRASGPRPREIVVVDDRTESDAALDPAALHHRTGDVVCVARTGGHGPATARDVGWRLTSSTWVAFLDDDVLPSADWCAALAHDLQSVGPAVGGVQGRVRVPVPDGRRLTDWERHVKALESAAWITADMAYRRAALESVDGFDRRFPRAFREDADLALRVREAGWELCTGTRSVQHPVGRAGPFTSVRRQVGNADDARMLVRHGRGWARRAGVPRGRRRRHAAICGAALVALLASTAHRPRAVLAAAGIAASGVTELAWARIRPGPRDAAEIARMAATSAAIPFVAVGAWLVGFAHALLTRDRSSRPTAPASRSRRPRVDPSTGTEQQGESCVSAWSWAAEVR